MKSREFTCKILEAVDDGIMDPTLLLEMALMYMSEADVRDMCETQDLFPGEEYE